MARTDQSPSASGLNTSLAFVLGGVYALVGLIGFAVTGSVDFAASHGGTLLGIFMLNPLHNVVHLLVGGLLLAGASRGERAASGVNALVGSVYLLVGVLGLFLIGHAANILALNEADNGLHFASAAVLLLAGAGAMSRRRMPVVDGTR